jgi:hypothetical protein
MKNLALLAGLGLAISAGTMNAEERTAPAAPGYAPGLGEIMSLQQMRHVKLWLAASRRNWALAAYELDELREGFEDASRQHPTQDGVPVAAMIESLTPGPLAAIGKAVEAKSPADFARAFDSLSDACNACHQGAKHGFIRIKRPGTSAFGNQDFSPGSK